MTEVGPRPPGSAGAEAARSYIRTELVEAGLEVIEVPGSLESQDGDQRFELTHLVGERAGASSDAIVLVAYYDTPGFEDFEFQGANLGGSGVALVLEMARHLATSELPYTFWFVFLEGEVGEIPGLVPEFSGLGARTFAAHMEAEEVLDRVRLLVAFDRVADEDLAIARDLSSHRTYRDIFWDEARRLGYAGAFPIDRGFEPVAASHSVFVSGGFRRVVAIADTRYGSPDETPGPFHATADDNLAHCSPESLEAVGTVSLAAIEAIGARFVKIDRFRGRLPADDAQPAAAEAHDAGASDAPDDASEPLADDAEGDESG